MPIFAMEKSILNKSVFFPLQVTWIRHRDVHILTVGQYTYTTDQRFLARHNPATDEWTLVIKYVQERDAGIYECQIPSRILQSYPINLNIVGKYITEFVLGRIHLPLMDQPSVKCVIYKIFFVFHLNSMKICEVVVVVPQLPQVSLNSKTKSLLNETFNGLFVH